MSTATTKSANPVAGAFSLAQFRELAAAGKLAPEVAALLNGNGSTTAAKSPHAIAKSIVTKKGDVLPGVEISGAHKPCWLSVNQAKSAVAAVDLIGAALSTIVA